MSLHTYTDVVQGTDEWLNLRRGIVTASTVGQLLSVGPPPATTVPCPECGALPDEPCVSRARKEPSPIKTLHATRTVPADTPPVIKPATGDTAQGLTTLLVAERITGWVDPVYVNGDMLRGTLDEPIAREVYARHYAPVDEVGFMVRTAGWGPLGYSPDGLVGDDGLIEIKAPRAKTHLATILRDAVPEQHMAQLQAGLLVSGRKWIDYVSFYGGLPLYVKRIHPDARWHAAIKAAVRTFEETAAEMVATYHAAVAGRPATERTNHDLGLVF